MLIEQDAEGTQTPYPVQSAANPTDLPLVLLINQGTASSAEIVAGALQDQHRAVLIGSTTFGTGTVLSTYDLPDHSAIFLGTAEWLTPDGHQIWHHGVMPDIPLDLSAQATPLTPDQETGMTPAQVQASQDVQLLRGVQALTQGD